MESSSGVVQKDSLNWLQAFLLGALIISICLNGYLFRRVRTESGLHFSAQSISKSFIGTHVPDLLTKDEAGRQIVVQWKSAPNTGLYYFSPSCIWCRRNSKALQSVVAQVGSRYRVVALSATSTGLTNFEQKYHLPTQNVMVGAPDSFRTTLGLIGTPTTIVIDGHGVVRGDWTGAYMGAQRSDIATFFGISANSIAPVPLS